MISKSNCDWFSIEFILLYYCIWNQKISVLPHSYPKLVYKLHYMEKIQCTRKILYVLKQKNHKYIIYVHHIMLAQRISIAIFYIYIFILLIIFFYVIILFLKFINNDFYSEILMIWYRKNCVCHKYKFVCLFINAYIH